jgi:hypothetical protein
VSTDAIHPNPCHRYALPDAAYLADAEEARYVAIAPDAAGFLVERGRLAADPSSGGPPRRLPEASPESFPRDALAVAVQRVCALAATWLGYDEWEVEQTRRLFLVVGST